MSTRLQEHRDEGFTLVELLIAMVIIGSAVSVLVVAMGSLTVASQQLKASAVAADATHTFAAAIQSKVSYTTTLNLGSKLLASDAPSSLTVSDASGFKSSPTTQAPMYLLVDQEVFKVTDVNTTTNVLTLATDSSNGRAEAGTTAGDHAADAKAMQYFVCPTALSSDATDGHVGYLTPDHFTPPQNSANNDLATVSIAEVDYSLDQTAGTFTNAVSSCIGNFGNGCPSGSFRPECDPGLERVDIRVQTKLPAVPNLTVDGWTMVRRGSN